MREAAASVVAGSLGSFKPSPEELRFLSKEAIPGLVLFKRNINQESYLSLKTDIIHAVHKARQDRALIISVDQEGGRVSRLGPSFPNKGSPLRLSVDLEPDEQVKELRDYGARVAESLLEIGINVNFAPVVDVLTNPLNISIGDRAFSLNPQDVIRRAGAFLEGMQQTGLVGCLKHFPGMGGELVDPHFDKVVIKNPESLLLKRELQPYIELLPHAKMIMISHCIYTEIDHKPASLSELVITELLKKQLGYNGLIVTDDMNMKAIKQDVTSWKKAIIETIAAGAHLVLVCSQLENWIHAIDALEEEAKKSTIFSNILFNAAQKVGTFRKNLKSL